MQKEGIKLLLVPATLNHYLASNPSCQNQWSSLSVPHIGCSKESGQNMVLDSLPSWHTWMVNKSRSISLVKRKLTEHSFWINEESILTVAEKPLRILLIVGCISQKHNSGEPDYRRHYYWSNLVICLSPWLSMTSSLPKLRSWNNWSASLPNSDLAFLWALPTHHCMGKESFSYWCRVLWKSSSAPK